MGDRTNLCCRMPDNPTTQFRWPLQRPGLLRPSSDTLLFTRNANLPLDKTIADCFFFRPRFALSSRPTAAQICGEGPEWGWDSTQPGRGAQSGTQGLTRGQSCALSIVRRDELDTQLLGLCRCFLLRSGEVYFCKLHVIVRLHDFMHRDESVE